MSATAYSALKFIYIFLFVPVHKCPSVCTLPPTYCSSISRRIPRSHGLSSPVCYCFYLLYYFIPVARGLDRGRPLLCLLRLFLTAAPVFEPPSVHSSPPPPPSLIFPSLHGTASFALTLPFAGNTENKSDHHDNNNNTLLPRYFKSAVVKRKCSTDSHFPRLYTA